MVIGVFGTNTERKQIPRVLSALPSIKDRLGPSRVVLYLHCRPTGYWRFAEMADEMGLREHVRFPTTSGFDERRGVHTAEADPTGAHQAAAVGAFPASLSYVDRLNCCDVVVNVPHSGDIEQVILDELPTIASIGRRSLPHHLGDLKTTARVAIVTGDPDRVPTLAQALGSPGAPRSRRGFVCVEANYGDEPVLVASTGIGGPTTAIVVEEISQLGIGQVIRIGTCGSMQPQVRPGHLVVSCGAVRDEGTSHQYLPASVPAVPDPTLLACILAEARRVGAPHHVSLTHCKDAYYAERPEGLPLSDEWSPLCPGRLHDLGQPGLEGAQGGNARRGRRRLGSPPCNRTGRP